MAADGQKRSLKKKACSNREKIKFSRPKDAGAQSNPSAYDSAEKTDCRND